MTMPMRLPAWTVGEQWTRIAWASERARSVWQPRLSAVNSALGRIELASVLQGHRRAAMLFKAPEDLPALTKEAISHGCSVLVLGLEGARAGIYAASSAPYTPGQSYQFRVAVTRHVEEWQAYADGDEDGIGFALGYPVCCSRFYREIWVDQGWRDTTLPMFERSAGMGTPYNNILLRWAGVRMVRHLPCSFGCASTDRIGRETERIGRELGLEQEMDWALEMLSWPIEWSSLHGIAEIKTPVLKISTSTDPLAAKAVVSREGEVYPIEGATGLRFPFTQPEKRRVTDSRSFAQSTGNDWVGNGFSGRATMEAAHQVVAQVAKLAISQLAATEIGINSMLDLGCGNAALLERICPAEWLPVGIEQDRSRLLAAAGRITHGHFTLGDIFSTSLWLDNYGVALLMPGRLAEADPDSARNLIAHLRAHAKKIVVYVYGDWMADGGVEGLCARFGLRIDHSSLITSSHAQAALLSEDS